MSEKASRRDWIVCGHVLAPLALGYVLELAYPLPWHWALWLIVVAGIFGYCLWGWSPWRMR